MAFDSPQQRRVHFLKHHSDFEPPPMTEVTYEARALAFLTGPLPVGALECVRPANSRYCRWNPATNEYGILAADGTVITYYKPVAGVHHREPTNMAYFHKRCA